MSVTTAAPVSVADEVHAWVEANWRLDLSVRDWWRLLVDAGYAYPSWPKGVGGLGLSFRDALTVTTTLASHGVVAPPAGHVAATLAAPTMLEHGTAQQIDDLVRGIALGEASWCQLFSEPGSGSDLASIGSKAERDGDEWIISGQKVWNSAANLADMGMLLARTDPDQPKHRGITYFAVDMRQPGVEARPLRVMSGAAPFCEVFLTDARVPASRMIGELNGGWRVAQTTMFHERNMVAGGGIPGLFHARSGRHGDLDLTVGEVIERAEAIANKRQSPIRSGAVGAKAMIDLARACGRSDDLVVRQELARYHSQVKVNGWTMRRIGAAGGKLTGADGSMAKLATSRICQDSRELSYRIVGADLLLEGAASPMGGDLQSVNLASPGTRIGGGTDEIQLNVLGERALGLPREPGGDQEVPYRDLKVGTQRV
ncbi:MAG TPA: acyl-CoA dehydrogenase family protein [Acidimicrobiales bacterium]